MDPYEVLGVPRDADEETIKKAYRSLIKKYHPDKYINTPMADMASEKTKEINKAYDMLTGKNQNTAGGGSGQTGYNPFGGSNPFGGGYNPFGGFNPFGQRTYTNESQMPPSFENVRILINMGRISSAIIMLEKLDKTKAEWFFLNGVVCLRRGWYDQALASLKRAMEMEPGNAEYAEAYNRVMNTNRGYTRTTYTNMGDSMCSGCSMPCCCWLPLCGCPGPCC